MVAAKRHRPAVAPTGAESLKGSVLAPLPTGDYGRLLAFR